MAGSKADGTAKKPAKPAGKQAKPAKKHAKPAKPAAKTGKPAKAEKQAAKAAKLAKAGKPERYTKTSQRNSNGRVVFRRDGSSALFVRRKDKTGSFVFRRVLVPQGGGIIQNFTRACKGLACN
jgi:hypothetical protein